MCGTSRNPTLNLVWAGRVLIAMEKRNQLLKRSVFLRTTYYVEGLGSSTFEEKFFWGGTTYYVEGLVTFEMWKHRTTCVNYQKPLL